MSPAGFNIVMRLLTKQFPSRSGTARRAAGRRGVATLDYVLVLGVVLPLVAVFVVFAPRGMGAVYEMMCGLISWPFM